jgi:hypothetical protein
MSADEPARERDALLSQIRLPTQNVLVLLPDTKHGSGGRRLNRVLRDQDLVLLPEHMVVLFERG